MEPPVFLIGTYHKTGTVWMRDSAIAAAQALDWPLFEGADGFNGPGIYFDDHTAFPAPLLKAATGGFRLIRDPRDVVIAGEQVHRRGKEAWLLEPQDRYGGRSYRDALLATGSPHDALVFEMDGAAGDTIRAMVSHSDTAPLARARYETLADDASGVETRALLAAAGLIGSSLDAFLEAIAAHAPYAGGRVSLNQVRSGHIALWQGVFDQALGRAFQARFPDALERLGYEHDTAWLTHLPVDVL
ncbi:hypothetical protein [Yunchengibacter salinarum]|uniref:hypothetical protein n=1 Tax=Yunchengibacter salinarum TaxID=3133399 RepID=UPI0035B5CE23